MSDKTRRQRIEEMLKDDPNDPFLRYGLGMELASVGDVEGAIRCFRELIQVAPEYVPAYVQAGQLLNRQGRTGEAAEVFRNGIAVAKKVNDLHAAGEMEGMLNMLE